jgi:hypothetical protein
MRERTFQSKTEALLNQKYWIPDIRDKIQKVIRNCVPCILDEKEQDRQEGFLNFEGRSAARYLSYRSSRTTLLY